MTQRAPVDLVLSCGFLAFAEQAGFLRAVERERLPVAGICGTSSGALAGALWAAGMPAAEVFRRLTERRPLRQVRFSARPWRGLLSLRPVIATLARDLPARFEDLPIPLGVGVLGPDGAVVVRTSGPLPEAVAASCAIPRLFGPVTIDDVPWADGGVVDRSSLAAWRHRRPDQPRVLHWVESGGAAPLPPLDPDTTLVRSPASGAQLWSLGDAWARYFAARDAAEAGLRRERHLTDAPRANFPG